MALDIAAGEPVTIAAKAVIIATGGLTRIYQRNSASANMGGDGYALALARRRRAGRHGVRAVLPDRASGAAPRRHGPDHVGPVPLQARRQLLNGEGREFLADYGSDESAGYTTPRDIATYAIIKEVEAGRGSPHGGVYLSFTHVPASRAAKRRSAR